jgi:hypothetical protein
MDDNWQERDERISLRKADKGNTLKNNPFLVAGWSLLVSDYRYSTSNEEPGTRNEQQATGCPLFGEGAINPAAIN